MGRAKPNTPEDCPFVSKGGLKLQAALDHFTIMPQGKTAADFGSHLGGFVDCLLQNGASKVYSVDTSYGTLAWKLRQDSRVIIYERTNAMFWQSPEPLSLITIDVGWTPQEKILPTAIANLAAKGQILSLLKPQYEKPLKKTPGKKAPNSQKRVLTPLEAQVIAKETSSQLAPLFEQVQYFPSPYAGSGGNQEFWFLLTGPQTNVS